jgi:ribosomal protein S18 acetylase RimI-like enzyme
MARAIREANEEDLEAIAAFFWAAWKEAGIDSPGWAGASDETLRELTDPGNLRSQVGGPFRRMFLALEGEEVVGFASLHHVDDEMAELAGIVVRKAHQGRGVGTRLVEAVAEAARAVGYLRIRVRTAAESTRALRFYEDRGFRKTQSLREETEDATVEGWELERDL